MSKTRRSVLVISVFMISTLLISACTQSLSAAPIETPTLLPEGLFVSPIASVENPMDMIAEFAQQTAVAQTAAAGGDPNATLDPNLILTPQENVEPATVTPDINTTPTNVVDTPLPAATSVPGVRPSTYTLQKGEFPYCIARRFDVDPTQLLSLSGLTTQQAYSLVAGTVLTIPQSGSFPGGRSLTAHPATYTVASSTETVYSVACKYGDVDPNAIASANNISVSATLTVGQQLQIP